MWLQIVLRVDSIGESILMQWLKVSKFRKQIVLYSFEPKTKRNISALRDRSLGQKYFVRFLVQMRTSQFAFEIFWPLTIAIVFQLIYYTHGHF